MAKTFASKVAKGSTKPTGKDRVRVIKSVRSAKTGAYKFVDAIVHKDKAAAFFAEK